MRERHWERGNNETTLGGILTRSFHNVDIQGLIKSMHFLTILWENKHTHIQGSYLFMPPCFPHLHLFLPPRLLPPQSQGRDARDGMHERRNQHTTHLPIGTSLPSQASFGNNVIYLCCSAVSAGTELLTDCAVSLCHLRARFAQVMRCSECCYSPWVNATLFSCHCRKG